MCHPIDCGCGHPGHHAFRAGWHHPVGCCCEPGYGHRLYPTREEAVKELEEYLKHLKAEMKGVEERIAELKKDL